MFPCDLGTGSSCSCAAGQSGAVVMRFMKTDVVISVLYSSGHQPVVHEPPVIREVRKLVTSAPQNKFAVVEDSGSTLE